VPYDRRVDPSSPAGTTPAQEREAMSSEEYDALRRLQLRKIAGRLSRVRPILTLPIGVAMLALYGWSGAPLGRVFAVAALVALDKVTQVVAGWPRSGGPPSDGVLFLAALWSMAASLVIVVLGGGLAGPFVLMPLFTVSPILVAFGRGRESTIMVLATLVGFTVVALLPAAWCGAPPPRGFFVAILLMTVIQTLVSQYTTLIAFTDAYQSAAHHLARLREDVLGSATERAHSLESVGARLGHELKNPLAAVKSLVQLLARGAGDDRTRERLDVIGSEVARMESLVREYLSFSRPLADLTTEPVALASLVDDVLAVLEARAALAGVTLARTGQEMTVVADPRRMKEALLNLTANALEATPSGGAVRVTLEPHGEGVRIAIVDSGRGIAPADLPRVGTPFYTTRAGGTGLGIVLARTTIVQHGGELHYESEPGRGTTVSITLPKAAKGHDGQAAAG
jgi:signal transduction histidine kinase